MFQLHSEIFPYDLLWKKEIIRIVCRYVFVAVTRDIMIYCLYCFVFHGYFERIFNEKSYLCQVSYRIMSYRIVSCHIVSCHIVLYCVVLYRIVSCRIVLYHVVSYHVVSCCIVSYRIVPCRIVSHSTVSYRIVSYRIEGLLLRLRSLTHLNCGSSSTWGL